MTQRKPDGQKVDRHLGVDIYLHNGQFEFRVKGVGATMGDDFDDPTDDDGLHSVDSLKQAKEQIATNISLQEKADKKLKSKALSAQAKVVIGNGQRASITGLHAKKLTPLFQPTVNAPRFDVNTDIDIIYPDAPWVCEAVRELVLLRKRMTELLAGLALVKIDDGPADVEGNHFSYSSRNGRFDDALAGLLARMQNKRAMADRIKSVDDAVAKAKVLAKTKKLRY